MFLTTDKLEVFIESTLFYLLNKKSHYLEA